MGVRGISKQSSWHTPLMVFSRTTLSDLNTLGADALKAILSATHEELITTQAQLLSRDHEIEHLKLLIAKLQRMQFGRRSEKIERQIEQLELKLEELETNRSEQAPPAEQPFDTVKSAPSASKPARRPLPEHLPRETKTHGPEHQCCPECGGTLSKLGEDVSEVLEYVPESFKVIRHVRPKLSCTACDVIVQAPAPSRPIERGIAGPALLAHVLTSKYCDHLPLHRQNAIYARQGVDLEDSTLADWVGASSRLVQPLMEVAAPL